MVQPILDAQWQGLRFVRQCEYQYRRRMRSTKLTIMGIQILSAEMFEGLLWHFFVWGPTHELWIPRFVVTNVRCSIGGRIGRRTAGSLFQFSDVFEHQSLKFRYNVLMLPFKRCYSDSKKVSNIIVTVLLS